MHLFHNTCRPIYHHHFATPSSLPPLIINPATIFNKMVGSCEDAKTGEEEKKQETSTPFDLNDYTIIREGEAEILMHTKNEVFYNKTQVTFFALKSLDLCCFVCHLLKIILCFLFALNLIAFMWNIVCSVKILEVTICA